MLSIIQKSIIDVAACAGKYGIEQSDLNPVAKEALKWGVDEVAYYLKNNAKITIFDISIAAFMSGVQRVVAIPYPLPYGKVIALFRVYGGNSAQFFSRLGLTPRSQQNCEYSNDLIQQLEKNYGVIIHNQI